MGVNGSMDFGICLKFVFFFCVQKWAFILKWAFKLRMGIALT